MPVPTRVSIPRRVFLGFALVLAVSGMVSVASIVQHQRTAATLHLLHEGYLPLSLAVSEVRAAQSVFDNLLDRLATEPQTASTRAWLNVARRARPERLARALNSIALIQGSAPPASERATLAKLRRELRRIRTALRKNEARYERLYAAFGAGDAAEAEALLADLRTRERAVDGRLRLAWKTVLERIRATSERASAQQGQAIAVLLVLGVIALMVGVAVTLWSQRVLSPLPKLQARVEAVARGDFVHRLGSTGDDEIARLAREFERMVAALATRDQRLRELQQTQAQILADLSAAVVVVAGDGSVRVANPAARTLLGLGDEVPGAALPKTGLLQRLPGLGEAMAEVADSGAPRAMHEVPLQPPADGEAPRQLNVLVRPFGGEGTGETALLLVAEDVTEALATKTRLIQTERLAAIGRMAAHITHEVRNPLSSIGLNVEMLEEELQDEPAESAGEARALLSAIHGEIERLRGVTEEYLRVARLPNPVLEAEDLSDLVQGTVSFMRREFSGNGVGLRLEIADALPLVAIDEAQLRQVLMNLLRNGREALEGRRSSEPERVVAGGEGQGDGLGEIRVRVAHGGASRGGVVLVVEDDGVGMDAETRARIFDLFYTTKKLGTGLGLPLTQQIVLAHGGKITCESTPDVGTRFELWFPGVPGDGGDGRDGRDGRDGLRTEDATVQEVGGGHD